MMLNFPSPREATKLLYDVSNGGVRYIFKRLSDIVYRFRTAFPSERQIPPDVAVRSLLILAKRNLDSKKLTDRERDILGATSAQKIFRVRDYAKFGLPRPQAFQRLVSKFLALGLLIRVDKSYNEVHYSTSGDVNLVSIV